MTIEKSELNEKIYELHTSIRDNDRQFANTKETTEALGDAEHMMIILRHRVEELQKENERLVARGTLVCTDPDSQKKIDELVRERDYLSANKVDLEKQVANLTRELGDEKSQNLHLKERFEDVSRERDRLGLEKADLMRNHDAASKERGQF